MKDAPKFEASGEYCVSTDSFVITPLIFNGGDIGKLCVCGSANDVSVQGGEPLYLNMGFILEIALRNFSFKTNFTIHTKRIV